jgi:DNA-binding transcriptional regulator YhcF (GntR family)
MSEQPEASAPRLDVAIDRDAEVPIGVQLAWALRSRIRDGRFRPGQRLPGLRELAEATQINVNTVRSVYQRLEQEGLIDSQQGSGTFVAPTPLPPSAAARIAATAAREAEATGVDPRDVAAALYVVPDSGARRPGSTARDDEAAARRRVLRMQIATLERAIAEMEAEHPGVGPPAAATRRAPGPRLLGGEELEQVRSALVRRLAAVQAAIDELASDAASERQGQGERRAERKRKPRPAPSATRPNQPRSTNRPAAAGT